LSSAKEELRLAPASKCPDLFSRRDDCSEKPESFLEVGVVGRLGKEPDVGDDLGDGGELSFDVELDND